MMLKKVDVLTHPTPARRDAPCPRRDRREPASSKGVTGMIPIAPIERAHSDRARSGSTGIVSVAPISFFSILLSTCKRRGPSDPSQHDPEDIRADRRQPEEPFQFAYERKAQQDHRKISTGHVLKKELRPRSLQWCTPRTLLTEG